MGACVDIVCLFQLLLLLSLAEQCCVVLTTITVSTFDSATTFWIENLISFTVKCFFYWHCSLSGLPQANGALECVGY